MLASMNDEAFGIEIIADYCLFFLNQIGNHSYVEYFGLDGPIDNASELIFKIATKYYPLNKVKCGKSWP